MLKFGAFLLASVVLGCALGAAVPDGRIVGGAPTTIQKYPYQVSVQYYYQHICGGSILGKRFVLTAAHCVDASASVLTVRCGSTYHNAGGQVVQVFKVSMHQYYKQTPSDDYDIAILELKTDLVLGVPIALPSHSYADNEVAYVSGWGALTSGGASPLQLYAVAVNIITASQCNSYYPGQITARMICAAAPGKDSCQGDSGGPLVVEGVQVGIVSWGYGCADPNYPGVYTNVFALRDWIYVMSGI